MHSQTRKVFTFETNNRRPKSKQGSQCPIYAWFLGLTLILSGCSYFTAAEAPPKSVNIPKQWAAATNWEQRPVQPWTREFADPKLDQLIEEAYKRNPSIQSLIASVSVAEEQTWISGSVLLPQIDAGISGNRNQRSNINGFSITSPRTTAFGFSLGFLWEIDLWYKLGNELEAAMHDHAAAESNLQAARLSLAANITKTWIDGIVAGQQVKLARKTITSFKNALDIIEQGYDRGIYQALDVRLARTSWINARGREQGFLRLKDEVSRTLEFSLGRYPAGKFIFAQQLPTLSETLPNSLPSSLLERRPDVTAASERFFASDQRLLKARKNMLPTIQFSGNGGTSARKLNEIFDPEFLIWNIASNLTQPLFHGTQLFAERNQAEARMRQAAADYSQVMLQAFREVETTMAAEQWLTEQEYLLIAEVTESQQAEKLAETDYISGLANITTLLEAQRRAFNSETNLLDIRKQRLQNRVNLYLALGGPVL